MGDFGTWVLLGRTLFLVNLLISTDGWVLERTSQSPLPWGEVICILRGPLPGVRKSATEERWTSTLGTGCVGTREVRS